MHPAAGARVFGLPAAISMKVDLGGAPAHPENLPRVRSTAAVTRAGGAPRKQARQCVVPQKSKPCAPCRPRLALAYVRIGDGQGFQRGGAREYASLPVEGGRGVILQIERLDGDSIAGLTPADLHRGGAGASSQAKQSRGPMWRTL